MGKKFSIVVSEDSEDYEHCSDTCSYLEKPFWQEAKCTLFHECIEDNKRCEDCIDNVWVFDFNKKE